MYIDISEIAPAFPDFRVAVVIAENLEIGADRPPELQALIAQREAAARKTWKGKELSDIPGVAAWRRAYRGFGIKRTSYRSSVERLLKNVLADRGLPHINPFVDAYNAVSLAHVMPLGADDLDKVTGDIAFRYARVGDEFVDMASGDTPQLDPPKEGEVVYADEERVLCRRWNWRQNLRSLVTPLTTRAVVTVQMNGVGDLGAAIADLTDLVRRFAGGTTRVYVVDRMRPRVSMK